MGDDFLANYWVKILDIATVYIGDYCLIGQHTLISTVGHSLSSKGQRRAKLAFAKPVVIGDYVWIGENCTILLGVMNGSNVVIAVVVA